MAVFNAAKREIDLKIVYYGPAMCGKTTNVQCIHKMLAPQQRGDLMSLATKDDRTLFFDFLPIELGDVRGFKTRFHIYTVPGQVYYALTRRAVLTGADGIVFVVDSQANKLQDNIESLKDLAENLRFYKKDLASFPFVLQYNKRDLPGVMPSDELNAMLNSLNVPAYESSAVTGMGVVETLTAICKIVLKQMDSGTAKKKTAQPAGRADLQIFEQKQAAALAARQAEQARPQPAKQPEAPASKAILPQDVRLGRPALKMQEPVSPFPDLNPLQAKITAPPPPMVENKLPESGFSPATESFEKEKVYQEDSSELMLEEKADIADELELSFDDEAATGLEFEEPAVELAEPELSFDDEAATGLEIEEPAVELAEPELSFDDEAEAGLEFEEPAVERAEPALSFDDNAEDLLIEEPAQSPEHAPVFEKDDLGLVPADMQNADEPQSPDKTSSLSFEEPEPVYIFDEPAGEDSAVCPVHDSEVSQISIKSCGRPEKISGSVVKLPLTLRLKDDAEYQITVTISLDSVPDR